MDLIAIIIGVAVIIFGIFRNMKRIEYYQKLEKNRTNNQLQKSKFYINTSLEIVILGACILFIGLFCKILKLL